MTDIETAISKRVVSADGFENVLKGIGGDKDPRQYNDFVVGRYITQRLANDLYTYNWLAAAVIDAPIDDATSKWRALLIPNADEKLEVETAMDRFGVKNKIAQALKWERTFGGAAIILVIDGEDPRLPLNIDNIRPGSLKNLIVLDRYNLYNDVVNRDILSENFGKPEWFTVVRNGQLIHYTRIIKFDGIVSSIWEFERQNFWGNSILTRLWEVISDSQITSANINRLVFESNVDVYKIAGLNALLAEGTKEGDQLAIKRLKIAHSMKSDIQGIALDGEDDYEKKQNVFTELPHIDDRNMQKVAGAARIPVTRLLGISPGGMNATGESDMRNYYDSITVLQENKIDPVLIILDHVISQSEGINSFDYKWKPLEVPSEADQADIDTKNASRDEIYLNNQIIMPSDVAAELLENGTYSGITPERVEDMVEEEKEIDFGDETEKNKNGNPNLPPEETGKAVSEGDE